MIVEDVWLNNLFIGLLILGSIEFISIIITMFFPNYLIRLLPKPPDVKPPHIITYFVSDKIESVKK